MITKKNLKYRKQKFKSNKVNHFNKNKIMKGGNFLNLLSSIQQVIDIKCLFDFSYKLDTTQETNLNIIRTIIDEQYIKFLIVILIMNLILFKKV